MNTNTDVAENALRTLSKAGNLWLDEISARMKGLHSKRPEPRFSLAVQSVYDDATTFHDGKWMMFQPTDTTLFPDLEALLHIKRKPDKKRNSAI